MQAFVTDIVTPFIAAIFGSPNFSKSRPAILAHISASLQVSRTFLQVCKWLPMVSYAISYITNYLP